MGFLFPVRCFPGYRCHPERSATKPCTARPALPSPHVSSGNERDYFVDIRLDNFSEDLRYSKQAFYFICHRGSRFHIFSNVATTLLNPLSLPMHKYWNVPEQ